MNLGPVFIVIAFAALAELLIEIATPLLNPLFSRVIKWEDVNPYLYLSLLVGIGLALAYQLDLIAALNLADEGVLGMVITGALLGRGANFVHDVISRLGG